MNMKCMNLLFLIPLLITPAYATDPPPCPIVGDPIHWVADACMAKLETDDEIAASDCINDELQRPFPDDCAAKRHYKRALCELALARETRTGSLESCMADKNFMGSTVENGGVGN